MSVRAAKARRARRRGLPDPRQPWMPTRKIDAAISDAAYALKEGAEVADVHSVLVERWGAHPTQAHHIAQAARMLAPLLPKRYAYVA